MSVKIKICGLVSTDDAALINESAVDLAGIVLFYPKSKRNRTTQEARDILRALKPEIKKAAVVVSPSAAQIAEIEALGFDYIQIHGELSDEVLRVAKLPILKAFNGNDLEQFTRFRDRDGIAGYVFDAPSPGSGKTFDLTVLDALPRDGKLFLLAGGLTPENVRSAIERIHPDGVDVSSAVEYTGRIGKDPQKVAAFIRAVRGLADV
ncbi:MAG: phosphoribosylanthranilate isomerase [Clostridium sp.]|nr:phosphoribosylanthranilate isomerase [Clostridium sp.]